MKVNMSTTITLRYSMTAADLASALASVPGSAKVSIRQEKYYNQMDPGGTFITLTWTEER